MHDGGRRPKWIDGDHLYWNDNRIRGLTGT